MRLGLFGKILLAFWLTLFAMSQGLWLSYAAQSGALSPQAGAAFRVGGPVLTLLADRVERTGLAEAERERRLLPPRLRDHISITETTAASAPPRSDGGSLRLGATAPDGRRYLLVYSRPGARSPLDIPTSVLVMCAAAGLVFSIGLALYITWPLALLRQGFRRMAQGDLDVQLEERIGPRGDEIADLARDFDAMASRLRHLLTARDRLLNDVSHELRSPLTRLQLAIGLARQDPRRTEDSLDRIDREACKLDAMVNELLTLARAESDAAEDATEYFDPIAVIESVAADAGYEAQASGRRIALQLPQLAAEGRPSVRGHAELVRRALENVVRNALRFSPPGGAVDIAVELATAPPRYRFRVADEGAGAQPEALSALFDPFVRGDPGGTGLGLAIAKRAILAHGGQISARNGEAGGFIVEIDIPAVLHDPAA